LTAESADGQDVLAVHDHGRRGWLTARRKGEGPSFLMCNTYAYTGHHVGDISREYYRSSRRSRPGRENAINSEFCAWLQREGCRLAALQKIESNWK